MTHLRAPASQESNFFVLTKHITDAAGEGEKSSAVKRLIPLLEELCSPLHAGSLQNRGADIVPSLTTMLHYEDHRVPSMACALLGALLARRRGGARGDPSGDCHARVMDACSKLLGAAGGGAALPRGARVSAWRAFWTAYSTSGDRGAAPPPVPAAVVQGVVAVVKELSVPIKEKKKLVQVNKGKKEHEKRERCFEHLIALVGLRQGIRGIQGAQPGVIATTAVEYSGKPKPTTIPIIRECLRLLEVHLRQGDEIPLPQLERCLPVTAAHMTQSLQSGSDTKNKTNKHDDTTEVPIFPTGDPFTALALARLCMTVLRLSGTPDTLEPVVTPWSRCLTQLVHHASDFVFQTCVLEIMDHQLGFLFLQPDMAYGASSDPLLTYISCRTKTLLLSTSQLEAHAGLRLCASLFEHLTGALMDARGEGGGLVLEQIEDVANTVHSLESNIEAVGAAFPLCPNITLQAFKALWWLAAFFFAMPNRSGAGDSDGWDWNEWIVEQEIAFGAAVRHMIETIDRNPNWNPTHSTTLLGEGLRVLQAVGIDIRRRMVQPFCQLLVELYCNLPDKTEESQLEPVLKELLLKVDCIGNMDTNEDNDTDADIVAHNCTEVGGCTLGVVLHLIRVLQPVVLTEGREHSARIARRENTSHRRQWLRELHTLVWFLGEYGNVMGAYRGDIEHQVKGSPNKTMSLILNTLGALGATHIHTELSHKCVQGLANIAFQSKAPVRRCVATHVAAIGGSPLDPSLDAPGKTSTTQHLVRFVLQALEEVDRLEQHLMSLQGVLQTEGANALDPASLVQLFDRHEALKVVLSLHCGMKDIERHKLLGKPSKPFLGKAWAIKAGR